MKLKCLGSSSKGNCYILESDTEALVLEVGISLMEVKKALDFNISKVVGALCSHVHKDHSRYLADYMKAGIEVYTSDETQSALEIITGEYAKAMVPNQAYKIGKFIVQPFELIHDAPCLGFYIRHKDFGKLLFITDTEYVPQSFKSLNVDTIMIESNYWDNLVCKDEFKRKHVLEGHMSIDTCCDFINVNKSDSLKNVILLHLSDGSSDEKYFLNRVKECVGNDTNVYIADKCLEVNINL